jgi:hypothetical protein
MDVTTSGFCLTLEGMSSQMCVAPALTPARGELD